MASPQLVTVYDTGGNVPSLPSGVEYALAYDDGSTVGQQILARFPHAKLIPITTVPGANNFAARECDCEANAFSPQQAAYWAHVKSEQEHQDPWAIYVEVALKDAVSNELATYDLEFGKNAFCHLAWWMDIPIIPQGIFEGVACGVGNIGCQYHRDSEFTWDVSVMLDSWVNPPLPITEEPMFDAIHIIPTPKYPDPKGSYFLNAGPTWIGPLDELSVIELQDNKAVIFQSKTNSIFNGKPVIPYPASTSGA
jgi:hypothetical protein